MTVIGSEEQIMMWRYLLSPAVNLRKNINCPSLLASDVYTLLKKGIVCYKGTILES